MSKSYPSQIRDRQQEIIDRIVVALEAGTAPWIKPWNMAGHEPHNGTSKRPYKGVNRMLLYLSGFADPRWYTYNNAKAAGGHVKAGEKGTLVCFWKIIVRKEEKDGKEKVQKIPFLRYYNVFNGSQIEGLPPLEEKPAPKINGCVEETISLLGVGRGTGDRAMYVPSMDTIVMPPVSAFVGEGSYEATLLHEGVHATGHGSRCNRQLGSRFGSEAYAFEELVAEIGAAFACARLGVQGRLQHNEYIGHWIKVLREDKYSLFTAARLAEEANTFLFRDNDEEEVEEE